MLDILADSGFLYAILDSSDINHVPCRTVLKLPEQHIYLPTITLPEVAFLVRRNTYPAMVANAIRALRKHPWLWIDALPEDFDRAADLIEQYTNSKLDLVDGVIVAMAERMNIQRIFTLDRRDFSIIRPNHCSAFELLP